MEISPQTVEGCFVVGLEPQIDERGYFARAFSVDEFRDAGMVSDISQINIAVSHRAGTIRGIHWQGDPHAEAKLVRCMRGRVFDVCVDVRPDSPTRGEWVGVELTGENGLALFVPPGCGHAHQTLEPDSAIIYSVSVPYTPGSERGARWDDPSFSIAWPIRSDVVVSEKDRAWPDFSFD